MKKIVLYLAMWYCIHYASLFDTAPDDYTALSETIMIAVSTQHRECRTITIQEDRVFENDETFHIILCLPPGSVDSRLRFTITRLYITIIDTTVFVEGESIELSTGKIIAHFGKNTSYNF